MSTGYTAGWKGEGLPALPSAAVTFNSSLTWNCMSALAVLTKEAIRFSNPNAEAKVRDDLGEGGQREDWTSTSSIRRRRRAARPRPRRSRTASRPWDRPARRRKFAVTDLASMLEVVRARTTSRRRTSS
jgi:hypothetical protein